MSAQGGIKMDRAKINYQIKFLSLLETYMSAGVAFVPSLESIADTFKGEEKDEIIEIKEKLIEGETLSKILAERGYNQQVIALVRAGESGGILDKTLQKAVDHLKTARNMGIEEEISAYNLLYDLLDAGVPIIQSLQNVATYVHDPELRRGFTDMKEGIKEGNSLVDIAEKYPGVFNPPIGDLFSIGETTGTLREQLQKIARHLKYELGGPVV